ncbi:hypothetical protein [Geobacter anodireducens]|uniref:hypothetical protein n=1 Tax=Geobacter soli TaxID=1510391 RepID=UPI00126A3D33|nr:hypothetical protein [Geobacter soli]
MYRRFDRSPTEYQDAPYTAGASLAFGELSRLPCGAFAISSPADKNYIGIGRSPINSKMSPHCAVCRADAATFLFDYRHHPQGLAVNASLLFSPPSAIAALEQKRDKTRLLMQELLTGSRLV